MLKLVLPTAALIAVAGCGRGEAKSEKNPKSQTVVEDAALQVTADAGLRPEKAKAAAVLASFAEHLLAGDTAAARSYLRIPESLNDRQVAFFLKELASSKHLSSEGVAQILGKDFGRLSERMGDKAKQVAEGAQVPISETYAFGDQNAAAVLHWDGKVFRVSALHNLGEP